MNELQPIITPPAASGACILPRQIAAKQRAYTASRPPLPPELPLTLPDTPLPVALTYMPSANAYTAAMLGRQLLLRRLQTFRPAASLPDDEAYTFPILKLTTASVARPEITDQSSHAGLSRTPPFSIPGYFTSKTTPRDVGVGEALLGCGTLLLISVVLLAILYYLAI